MDCRNPNPNPKAKWQQDVTEALKTPNTLIAYRDSEPIDTAWRVAEVLHASVTTGDILNAGRTASPLVLHNCSLHDRLTGLRGKARDAARANLDAEVAAIRANMKQQFEAWCADGVVWDRIAALTLEHLRRNWL